jgi:hypothetical protein
VSKGSLIRSASLHEIESKLGCVSVSLTFWASNAETKEAMDNAMGFSSQRTRILHLRDKVPGVLRRIYDALNSKPLFLIFQNNHFEPLHPLPR